MSEKKFAQAYLKSLRVSPIKLGKVTRAIAGLPVDKAMMQLTFCNLKSAMTNAENNHGMDIDKLVIHRIDTGKAFVMRRFRARAKGRGTRIEKPFSHVRIVLTEVEK